MNMKTPYAHPVTHGNGHGLKAERIIIKKKSKNWMKNLNPYIDVVEKFH